MNEKERLETAQGLWTDLNQLLENRKAIGHEIKEIDKKIEETFGDDSKEQDFKKVKKLFNQKKAKEGNRSGVNAQIKKMNASIEDCIFGRKDYDKEQLTFKDKED